MTAEIPPKAPDTAECPNCDTDIYVDRHKSGDGWVCRSCETRWSE